MGRPPPLIRAMPKRKRFFQWISSLSHLLLLQALLKTVHHHLARMTLEYCYVLSLAQALFIALIVQATG